MTLSLGQAFARNLGNAMSNKLKITSFIIFVSACCLLYKSAGARVGETYYCERTAGFLLDNFGDVSDYHAQQKHEGYAWAFLVRHLEKSFQLKHADYTIDFDIVIENFGTDIRAISKNGQMHFVLWVEGVDKYSFSLTKSDPYFITAELGFCRKYM